MKQFRRSITFGTLAAGLWAGACSDSPSRKLAAPSSPASLQVVAGAGPQSAMAGASVGVPPAVAVKDADGNTMPGQTVAFVVTAGGGSVANATATTNAQGVASAGTWTLGPNAGTNVLEARIAGATAVQFTATATAAPAPAPISSSPYAVTVRYLAAPSSRQQLAVQNAVARWETVLTRDLFDIPVSAPVNSCFTGQPAINERVDDILILIEFVEIDGSGKVLGEAGPCYVRSDNGLPVLGHLKLDAADLRLMESNGTIDDVVLHEIGHVLGIGTLWPDRGLLQGQGTDDPGFLGANAISAYRTLGGLLASVPVENTGGAGTRDGHWRESVFGNELMTGWVTRGGNPLSAMTIASLEDLGYGANSSAASGYTLGAYAGGAMGVEIGSREIRKRPKFKIDRRGQKKPL